MRFFTFRTRQGKDGNSLYFRDLTKSEKTFTPIMAEITDDSYSVIDNVGDKFLIETNHGAPNGKVVLYDPATENLERRDSRKARAAADNQVRRAARCSSLI